MISFPSIGRYGRLGNQLFQYAAGRSLALHHNTDLFINDPETSEWHGQKCLLNNFNINVIYEQQPFFSTWSEPDAFDIEQDFFSLPDNICINGFFQSMFYFEKFERTIRKELTPKILYNKSIDELRSFSDKPIVSIHVRRGDNIDGTDNSQVELRNMYSSGGIYERYISKSIKMFGDVNFMVFSGGKRGANNNSEDIDWCKSFFKGSNFFFSENNSVVEDLSGIILCDHNIISHVSSFGWWGAYLNMNRNKIVVAPKNYNPDIPHYTHRYKFYPEDWKLI